MPKHIVLLEDEPLLLELLQQVLLLEGHQATCLSDPQTLIQVLRAERPDAVLLDVNLQDGNGLDLLGKIRADHNLKDLFVILSSGMDYRQNAHQAGANAFLMKPYSPGALLDLLESPGALGG